MIFRNLLAVTSATCLITFSHVIGAEEYVKVKKHTFVNLVDLLVKRGVIGKNEGSELVNEAESESKPEPSGAAATEAGKSTASAASAAAAGGSAAAAAAAGAAPAGNGAEAVASVAARVPPSKYVAYVPTIVKDEIREQVRKEVRAEVLADVKDYAQKQKWGIPDALPSWVSRIIPYFDMRLRIADDFYQSDNAQYYDWLAINKDGGISQALAKNQAYLNTTVDRLRIRERFRVGFDAKITESIQAGLRFATSNMYNPVSNNQTLGNTGESWQFAIDRAYLQYDFVDSTGNDWFTLWGGRYQNPFVSTDIVFDPDLSFQGFAGTFRLSLNRDDEILQQYRPPNPTGRFGINMGPQRPDTIFATIGAFPIEEINFSSNDKWLYAFQLGGDWLFDGDSRLKFAGSYYDYENMSAIRNSYESLTYNYTAPQFIQKGNSLVAINDAKNQPDCNTGPLGSQNICLAGLASGFKIVNATAMFDYAHFAPIHAMLTLDYAKNLGFDQEKIYQQFGVDISPKTNAYQVRLDLGKPMIMHWKDWNFYFAYRYLERDSVLDAFTDSVFHQGGTDAKGWVLAGQFGLATNTWLNIRWFSTQSVNGPPNNDMPPFNDGNSRLSIDTLTVDLNARF